MKIQTTAYRLENYQDERIPQKLVLRREIGKKVLQFFSSPSVSSPFTNVFCIVGANFA